MGVRRFGPKVGDHERLFQGEGGRHDFAVDGLHGSGLERSLVGGLHATKHIGFALGDIDAARGYFALQFTDLLGERGAGH